mgnify:CR=1 FL=1
MYLNLHPARPPPPNLGNVALNEISVLKLNEATSNNNYSVSRSKRMCDDVLNGMLLCSHWNDTV